MTTADWVNGVFGTILGFAGIWAMYFEKDEMFGAGLVVFVLGIGLICSWSSHLCAWQKELLDAVKNKEGG